MDLDGWIAYRCKNVRKIDFFFRGMEEKSKHTYILNKNEIHVSLIELLVNYANISCHIKYLPCPNLQLVSDNMSRENYI